MHCSILTAVVPHCHRCVPLRAACHVAPIAIIQMFKAKYILLCVLYDRSIGRPMVVGSYLSYGTGKLKREECPPFSSLSCVCQSLFESLPVYPRLNPSFLYTPVVIPATSIFMCFICFCSLLSHLTYSSTIVPIVQQLIFDFGKSCFQLAF